MDLDTSKIIEDIKQNGFYIAKSLIPLESFTLARKEAMQFFAESNLKNKNLPNALRGGVKAGMIDNYGYSSNKSWKIFRLCAFPWNRPLTQLENTINLSRKVSKLRNRIIGIDQDYGSYIENDNYIQYTSLSLYPAQGGFLNKHKDTHNIEDEIPMIHFKIELTLKNKDYKEGGFTLWDRNNKEISISDLIEPGDVLFFDGSLSHEIKTISGEIGRIALFEIPTYVDKNFRDLEYLGDGVEFSFQERLKRKLISFINKFINKLKDY